MPRIPYDFSWGDGGLYYMATRDAGLRAWEVRVVTLAIPDRPEVFHGYVDVYDAYGCEDVSDIMCLAEIMFAEGP